MAWQCEIFSTPHETAIYFLKFTDPVISLRHSLTTDLIATHQGLWIWFWRVWTHSPPHFLTLVEPLPSPSVSTCCGASVALSQDALFMVFVGTGSWKSSLTLVPSSVLYGLVNTEPGKVQTVRFVKEWLKATRGNMREYGEVIKKRWRGNRWINVFWPQLLLLLFLPTSELMLHLKYSWKKMCVCKFFCSHVLYSIKTCHFCTQSRHLNNV